MTQIKSQHPKRYFNISSTLFDRRQADYEPVGRRWTLRQRQGAASFRKKQENWIAEAFIRSSTSKWTWLLVEAAQVVN